MSQNSESFYENAKHAENPFVYYMGYLIKKSGRKRKDLIEQSGLSYDFMRKVLNGTKKTTERDYILALCLTMGISSQEVLRVLELASFAPLQHWNVRERNILDAFKLKMSVDDLNSLLIQAESAPLKNTKTQIRGKNVEHKTEPPEVIHVSHYRTTGIMRHKMSCPKDAFYQFYVVQSELTSSEPNEEKVYLRILMQGDGTMEYNVMNRSVDEMQKLVDAGEMTIEETESAYLEFYDTLAEARKSEFFTYFVELNYELEKYISETRKSIADSKHYRGRVGIRRDDVGEVSYAEGYDSEHPERQEYYQIVKRGDTYTYSASHMSFYLVLRAAVHCEAFSGGELGPYGPHYVLFKVHSLEDLNEYAYMRPWFEALQEQMLNAPHDDTQDNESE